MSGVVFAETSIRMLGCFELTAGDEAGPSPDPVRLPLQAQRVIAFLVVNGVPIDRGRLAERLWPYAKAMRAQSNLRTALWRIRRDAPGALQADRATVGLSPLARIDYRELLEESTWPEADPVWSGMTGPPLRGSGPMQVGGPEDVGVRAGRYSDLVARLRNDLLPGWDEEWLMIERERVRQLRMRRLEALSRWWRESGEMQKAISAAYGAIWIEPLRESAHLALMEAHVADGNRAEAVQELGRTVGMLKRELGVEPSGRFWERVRIMGLPVPGHPDLVELPTFSSLA